MNKKNDILLKKWSVFSILSLCTPFITLIIFMSYIFGLITWPKQVLIVNITSWPGLLLIGIIFGVIARFKKNDKTGLIGIILNTIVLLIPIIYFVIGTLVWGP
ncbi:hypothetical protein [Clostridium kluyveri]|uniref:hypothetical protein n=1 Tax=Clostridium kluyveri TaxID=1534 RepID=UPI0022483649|nr:hypothetical protein [Clostridium kluyveri]UZQ49484.1 hypothetical protein OP486_16220 [Clostridium kluyveri]